MACQRLRAATPGRSSALQTRIFFLHCPLQVWGIVLAGMWVPLPQLTHFGRNLLFLKCFVAHKFIYLHVYHKRMSVALVDVPPPPIYRTLESLSVWKSY